MVIRWGVGRHCRRLRTCEYDESTIACSWLLASDVGWGSGRVDEKAWPEGESENISVKEDCDGLRRLLFARSVEESRRDIAKSMMNTHIAYGKGERRSVKDVDRWQPRVLFFFLSWIWFSRAWSDAAFCYPLVIKWEMRSVRLLTFPGSSNIFFFRFTVITRWDLTVYVASTLTGGGTAYIQGARLTVRCIPR